MASYVQETLGEGEEILYKGECSIQPFWPLILVGAFLHLYH